MVIDTDVKQDGTDCMIQNNQIKTKKYRGVVYRHADVKVETRPTLCFDSLGKDRKNSAVAEIFNLSIGLVKHVDVLT